MCNLFMSVVVSVYVMQMSAARDKIAERCEFCAHYESQMQAAQASERQALVLLRAVEHQLELERQAMNKQQNYVTELESNLQTVSEQTKQQVCLLLHNFTNNWTCHWLLKYFYASDSRCVKGIMF